MAGVPQPHTRYQLSAELQAQIAPIERQAWIDLRMGRYETAENQYREMLRLITESQTAESSLHKGTPLHQIGLCLYLRNMFLDSVRSFLLAYCEDALSAEPGQEDNQDRMPACRVLRDIFLIDLTFLRRIKDLARNAKERQEVVTDPNELLEGAAREHGTVPERLLGLCQATEEMLRRRNIDPIQGSWPGRVFIGGPFTDLARLRDIQEIVIRLGYDPILTEEIGVDPNLVYHHNLMLLHTCRFAVFEVSRPAGQLMEIERSRDYGIQPLLLYSSRDGECGLPAHLSAMLRTAGFNIRGYRDSVQLNEVISEYLPHQ